MSYYLTLAAILFVYMTLWFGWSLLRKRNDVADIAWGLGFVILTWSALYLSGNYDERQLLVTGLVTLWGLRLAWHIMSRNRGKGEDYRYKAWREQWGKWFILRSYGQIYLLQGALLYIIILPVLYIQEESYRTLGVWDLIGVTVWAIGFLFEAVGDFQLRRFTKEPSNKGKILTTGLWRYTRHPNYFGEVTQWWGIWLIALSVPGGFWTIIGPLTITYLIIFVSGIPMLEKRYAGNQEFENYKKKTSVFFPLPPNTM
jgi:steroid 5-alpha reductase family enzyme